MHDDILASALAGKRLTCKEGIQLFDVPLLELFDAADQRCRQLNPQPIRTFLIGRNVNYTNICISACAFCAFYRGKSNNQAYLLTINEVLQKVAEMVAAGGSELLLQGGLNPDLPLSWYEELFQAIHDDFPTVQIHALSPSEIIQIANISGISSMLVLQRLQVAGLQSIPGGGAEILVDRLRQIISPRKATVAQWLQVMREANELGMHSTATMMYGHLETLAERIAHLDLLRKFQDETGAFYGFIHWPFQPGETRLAAMVEAASGHTAADSSAVDFLRMTAISRLFFDNVAHIQSSWLTMGTKIGQVALNCGADDLGSTLMEEQVVRAAGSCNQSNASELAQLIRDCGYQSWQRDTSYRLIRQWE